MRANKEVDDGFYLTITFKSGAVAFVEVGTYNFISMPRFYMKAEKGSALIIDWKEKTQVAKCKYWHENDVLPVQTAAGLTKTMAPRDSVTLDTYELDIPKSDVHDFYRNFVSAIDGKTTHSSPFSSSDNSTPLMLPGSLPRQTEAISI